MPFDIEEARARVAGMERADPRELHERIQALARPRLTGSQGAAEVDAELRERFEGLGYGATDLDFSFSTLPGRFGLPVAGGLVLLTGGIGGALVLWNLPVVALVVLVVGIALATLPLLLLDPAVERLPWGRVDTANVLFARPNARPAWIVMAHRDSKGQLVPTLLRSASLIAAALGWLALVVLAALWIAGDPLRFGTAVWVAGVVVVVAGLVLTLSWASNGSPGAVDNASGLAALLTIAGRVGDRSDVAFLVTDGEELGLAGARAVADRLPPVQGVVNVDGLDDGGTIYVAEGHGWRRRGTAPQLAAALLTAGTALELPVRRRRLPRTFTTDHVAIAAAGVPALTVMRGRRSTLLRVHRPSDRADRIDGRGAAETATLLAAALSLLRAEEASHLASPRATGS